MSRIDDIARYAEGLMKADELAAFEAELTADALLQQQLALYKEVHTSMKQHFGGDEQQQQLQQTLQGIRGEFFRSNATKATGPAKVIPFKRYLRKMIAVAAILLTVVFIWQSVKPDPFNEYVEITMVAPIERGGEEDRLLQEATTAFNNKDFPAAAAKLGKLMSDTGDTYVAFYYGVSLLHFDKPNRVNTARAIFNRLYNGESAFKYEAAFFQALSYLKEDETKSCITWLQKIPADAPNYSKAQELLKKLQ
jgi:hypothetical protein